MVRGVRRSKSIWGSRLRCDVFRWGTTVTDREIQEFLKQFPLAVAPIVEDIIERAKTGSGYWKVADGYPHTLNHWIEYQGRPNLRVLSLCADPRGPFNVILETGLKSRGLEPLRPEHQVHREQLIRKLHRIPGVPQRANNETHFQFPVSALSRPEQRTSLIDAYQWFQKQIADLDEEFL